LISQKNNSGSWGKATSLTYFNNQGNNAVTGIHKDGQRIYLLNSYEDNLGTKAVYPGQTHLKIED
jgi:hypothetical protein